MSTQPPQKVPITAIERAIDALLKHKSQKSASKNPQLLPSDEFLYLTLTLTKIPQKSRVNAFKIALPHPLYSPENSEICVFVNDAKSKIAKLKIEEEKLPIAKVMKLTKLKKEYKAYELKRKLCDSYDLFMAEKRIIPLLPNAIGKGFYKKKKIPIPIEMSRGNWKDQIDRICNSALLYLSTGSCSVIKVARVSMERAEIVANVGAAIEGIANVVPKKWGNVRSFHLKLAESVALPVYQKVPELGFKISSSIGDVVGVKEKSVVEVVKKAEKKSSKKKTTKGRIHEVNYMDEVLVKDQELVSDCLKCCVEDSDDSMSKVSYAGALLEVCMRKLVFYPEIVGFIEEEKESFPSVKVQYSFNSPPKMIMLDDNGEHAETIRIDNWKREHILQFLRGKLKSAAS